MIHDAARRKGAPSLGAFRPGDQGPFGSWPADDALDDVAGPQTTLLIPLDVDGVRALVRLARRGSVPPSDRPTSVLEPHRLSDFDPLRLPPGDGCEGT